MDPWWTSEIGATARTALRTRGLKIEPLLPCVKFPGIWYLARFLRSDLAPLDLVTPSGRLMANILAGVAAYETEVRAERILAGQTAARMRGVRWGGSARGRRIKVTVEQIVAIRRMKSEGQEIAAIARGTGLSRPTIYRILGELCNASTASSDSKPVAKMDYGDRSASSVD